MVGSFAYLRDACYYVNAGRHGRSFLPAQQTCAYDSRGAAIYDEADMPFIGYVTLLAALAAYANMNEDIDKEGDLNALMPHISTPAVNFCGSQQMMIDIDIYTLYAIFMQSFGGFTIFDIALTAGNECHSRFLEIDACFIYYR